jgi:hypothetical protein
MNRYEEVFMRIMAADIAHDSLANVSSIGNISMLADKIMRHFQERELGRLKDRAALADLPSILRPQAE